MTPRERLWTALNHKEPDQTPLDLNGTCCTALTKLAYQNLRQYLGLAPDDLPDISAREGVTVRAREDLLRHYEIDTRTLYLRAPLTSTERDLPDGSYYDEYGIRWRPVSNYYVVIERPLANATMADLAAVAWPDPYDPGRVAGLRAEAKQLFETTPYCLVADMPGFGPFEGCCMTRGHAQFCMDLCLEPDFSEALLDKVTDTTIAFYDVLLREVGAYIQVVSIGDDVSTQTASFISPKMYRQFVKPRHKRIFDFIHSKTDAKIFYHSCGSVYSLIPDFIEEGVDILNPVQTSAAHMDLAALKREFGGDICFWGGGIDIQNQLPFFSLEEIEAEVNRTLDILTPGGGFVFFPTHNIQADVTPDRIDRMFTTVKRYRPG